MSVESFRELCNKGKFYWFDTVEDFEKGIDYDGINQRKQGVQFNRGYEDMYKENKYDPIKNACPSQYMAYGIK